MSFPCLDMGTMGCKALAVGEDGRVIALAYHDYPLVCPKQGWNEIASEARRHVAFATRKRAGSLRKLVCPLEY